MARPWRLLVDGSASGPFNMGVDEALLETALREGRPSVRFYRWRGPWLSLGYGQRRRARGDEGRRAAGVGVVRRSTGGRAVLHGCDLTYAVAAPAHLLPEGLRPTYALIAGAVAAALGDLGVAVERVDDPSVARSDSEFDCFATPVTDELCVGGRKLVGSAQRRVGAGVLQHGSIRVTADPPQARAALGLGDDVATSLAELGRPTGLDALLRAFVRSFGEALDACFEAEGLSDRELLSARARGVDPVPAGMGAIHAATFELPQPTSSDWEPANS